MPEINPPRGWYRDPTQLGDARYWDGAQWTDSVNRAGATVTAPIDPQRAFVPPAPGTEFQPQVRPEVASSVTVNAPRRSSMGAVAGVIGAVLIALVIIALIVNNNSSDDEAPQTTDAPQTTEAPDDGG